MFRRSHRRHALPRGQHLSRLLRHQLRSFSSLLAHPGLAAARHFLLSSLIGAPSRAPQGWPRGRLSLPPRRGRGGLRPPCYCARRADRFKPQASHLSFPFCRIVQIVFDCVFAAPRQLRTTRATALPLARSRRRVT